MENKKNKIMHIILIAIGILFVSIGAFHTNLWFDETYSVALAKHSFSEIWTIGGNDVHPILYYMFLKIINIIFNGEVLAYRLFSVLGIAILGTLGFTHIRKDFGEKTGMLFSFLSFFLPVMAIYASEIRMYSWAVVFVTLTAIYAYRLTKQNTIKNWIIFGICSLASLYTHYYGVMAAGLINIGLFIYFIRKADLRKNYLVKFLITGVSQFVLYAPWLYCFLVQLKNVSKGFWITLDFPGTIFDVMDFQCLGKIDSRIAIVLAFSLFVVSFFVMNQIKEDKAKTNPGKSAILVYFGVIIAALLLSFKTPILYPRYLFVVTGLLIFFWSYFISKCKSNKLIYTLCAFIAMVSIFNNVKFVMENYDKTNMTQIEYIKDNINDGDIFIYNNPQLGSGSVVDVNIDGYTTYFYDSENWNVEKAYEAYGPDMITIHNLDNLEEYKGRMWIIDSSNLDLYNEISEKYDITLLEKNTINTKYQNYLYNIVLIEKN